MSSYYAIIAVYHHTHLSRPKEVTAIRSVSLDSNNAKEICCELAQSNPQQIVRAFITWHELDDINSMIVDEDIAIYTCDNQGNITEDKTIKYSIETSDNKLK